MTEINKRQTYGNFEATGIITVTPDTFQINLDSKNNPTYKYSRVNMKMEDNNGGSFYLNVMDGFDSVKGKMIYANIKDSETNEQMKIAFSDRHNEEILKHIADKSLIRVALRKVKNEESGRMEWEYKDFLAMYDVISYLKDRLQTGMKLRVTGQTKYSMYNDRLNKDLQVQRIYVLPEDDNSKLGFTFSQNVILTEGCLDDSKWESENILHIKSKVRMRKSAGIYETYTLPLVLRANPEKKESYQRMIDRYLKVDGDTVRRIRLEGRYNIGYVATQVTKEDLPQEALELIEDGFYTEEEVLKMYANRDRVDEMTINRPSMIKPKNEGEKPRVDMSDDEFKLEDLVNTVVEPEPEIVVETSDDDDLSFLEELD